MIIKLQNLKSTVTITLLFHPETNNNNWEQSVFGNAETKHSSSAFFYLKLTIAFFL